MSAWTPRATTLLTAVVVAMTLGGSYVVARAIGVGHASDRRLVPVTREALVRSVARIVDARLSADRLQILLTKKGAATSPAAALVAQQQKLAQIAGLAISRTADATGPSSGADGYVAKGVGTAGASLTRRLASLIAPDAIEALSLKGDATDASAVEDLVGKALAANHADRVTSTWVSDLSSEPGLQHGWMLLDAGETFDSFLRTATSELSQSIARQVATDLTLETVPATEADSRGSDLSARLAWAIAAVLFIGLWTAAVAVAVQQIAAFAPHAGVALAGTVLAGATAGWLLYWSALTPASLEVLGPLLQVLETQRHTQIAATSRVLGALAAAAIVVLLAAAWAILQGVPCQHEKTAPTNRHCEPASTACG
ncbi:MAG TPA: hypothetical protein VGQ37_23440 [Vicinamibacterales bacterium]|jgi:hypothetical protein|nr:hypothetical protein [Vicinamibacterales bacterium]